MVVGGAAGTRATAQTCKIGFNTYASLAALPDKASATFASPPYYQETCGAPNSGWNPVFTLTPLSIGHYHLSPDVPTCTLSNGTFGKPSGSSCVPFPDYASVPRYVASHGQGQVLQLASTPGDQFDLVSLKVKTGSPQIDVRAFQPGGGYWHYFFNPGSPNPVGNNRWLTKITMQTADGSTFSFDDLVIEPSFSTHRLNGGTNSLGWWNGYDWAYGQYKASCELGKGLSGISAATTSGQLPRAIRCRNHVGWAQYGAMPPTAVIISGNAQRTSSRGDWDPGYVKGECSDQEVVAGVGVSTDGKLATLMCGATGANPTTGPQWAKTCTARALGSNASSVDVSPWASGYHRTECADNEVIKGISRNASGGVHKILCCTYPGMMN
jgi:hypothetical protein